MEPITCTTMSLRYAVTLPEITADISFGKQMKGELGTKGIPVFIK